MGKYKIDATLLPQGQWLPYFGTLEVTIQDALNDPARGLVLRHGKRPDNTTETVLDKLRTTEFHWWLGEHGLIPDAQGHYATGRDTAAERIPLYNQYQIKAEYDLYHKAQRQSIKPKPAPRAFACINLKTGHGTDLVYRLTEHTPCNLEVLHRETSSAMEIPGVSLEAVLWEAGRLKFPKDDLGRFCADEYSLEIDLRKPSELQDRFIRAMKRSHQPEPEAFACALQVRTSAGSAPKKLCFVEAETPHQVMLQFEDLSIERMNGVSLSALRWWFTDIAKITPDTHGRLINTGTAVSTINNPGDIQRKYETSTGSDDPFVPSLETLRHNISTHRSVSCQ